jgi:ABC-2 type transport system permease protein
MRKNKMILGTLIAMPVVFAIVLPVFYVYMPAAFGGMTDSDVMEFRGMFPWLPDDLPPDGVFIYFMLQSMMAFFLILPGVIPTLIAAYSIIGEKKTKSLEPLLATPITTLELFFGKIMAAVIPTVGATWGAFAIFCIIVDVGTYDLFGYMVMPDITWLLAIFIVAPLFAIMSVIASTIVSSRMRDIRSAEQVSAFFIIPVMILFIGPITGMFIIDALMILLLALLFVAIDILLLFIGVGLFDRENILIKWK